MHNGFVATVAATECFPIGKELNDYQPAEATAGLEADSRSMSSEEPHGTPPRIGAHDVGAASALTRFHRGKLYNTPLGKSSIEKALPHFVVACSP
jgi:hypothetical protein